MRLYNIVHPAALWHFCILHPATNNFIYTTTHQNLSTGFIFNPPHITHKYATTKTRTSKQTPLYQQINLTSCKTIHNLPCHKINHTKKANKTSAFFSLLKLSQTKLNAL